MQFQDVHTLETSSQPFTLDQAKSIVQTGSVYHVTQALAAPSVPTVQISQATGEVTVNTPKVEAAKKNYTLPIIAMLGIAVMYFKEKA